MATATAGRRASASASRGAARRSSSPSPRMAGGSSPSACWRAKWTWASKAGTSGCGGSRTAWRCWAAGSRSTARRGAAPSSTSRSPGSESPVIKVLLADDHAIVLEGLRALLESEPDMDVVGATTDGTEVTRLVEHHKPDVIVLDLQLAGIKGTQVIAALRARPAPPKEIGRASCRERV